MSEDIYKNLREKLSENTNWPLQYMFKFIVSNIEGKVDQVAELLPQNGKLSFKHTKNLKHVSVTCIADMASVDDIIYILDKVTHVDGVMVL